MLVNRRTPNKLASRKLTQLYIFRSEASSQDVQLVAEKESFVQVATENVKVFKKSWVSGVTWK